MVDNASFEYSDKSSGESGHSENRRPLLRIVVNMESFRTPFAAGPISEYCIKPDADPVFGQLRSSGFPVRFVCRSICNDNGGVPTEKLKSNLFYRKVRCDDERSEEERVRFNCDQNKNEPSERSVRAAAAAGECQNKILLLR
ncbi:hypothetical protein MSG28_012349 [Choristoneura fumiferana]|uniref:Uncharacterized protein n=1 Tax=Choristoneura fumiferana TaxID=7141 RepID=A0ACC0KCQ9_CHOFU|nr:hypothetical protein MSG28_012349 [Choristoneura fumiferana]